MDVNLFSAELTANPFDLYAELREIGKPVKHSTFGFWMIATHAQVDMILKNPGAFSSEAMGNIGRVGEAFAKESMSAADPPDHHRLRSVVQRAFTPRAVTDLGNYAEGIVAEALSEIQPGVPFELFDTLANALPLRVITKMMGVGAADESAFRRWASALVVGNSMMASAAEAQAADNASQSLRAYFSELIPERRARPGDDVVSGLIAGNHDNALSDRELLAACVFFLFAGMETTTNLISNTVLALTEFPDEQARLVADPALMKPATEEFLRFCSPPQAVLRMATDDVEISGEKVSKGDYLLLLLGSANRDELVFTDPAQLLIDRNPNPHVAFSLGPHYCLGAHLARLETQIAIRRLLECAPKLRRLNADEPLTYRPGLFIRSMERLEVVF